MLARSALAAALLVLASGSPSLADVVPEGQRYVPIETHLAGVASGAGDHALYLVTVSAKDGGYVQLAPVPGDGRLSVSGGYMHQSYLIALTPAQVTALDAARGGVWIERPEDDVPGPLRAFVDGEGLARSPRLPHRTLVDHQSQVVREVHRLKLAGVGGGAVRLEREVARFDAGGEPVSGDGSSPLGLIFAIAAGALGLLAVAVFALRGRRRTAAAPTS